MEITSALLADAAAVADGKLYIHGGLWNQLNAIAFPVTHPSMSVALALRVEYNEALDPHDLEVTLTRDGSPVGPFAKARLKTGHSPNVARGAPMFVPMALTFPLVAFAAPGRYEWTVRIDGDVFATVPLEVVQMDGAGFPQPSGSNQPPQPG